MSRNSQKCGLAGAARDLEIPNQIPHCYVQGVGENLKGAEGHALAAGFDAEHCLTANTIFAFKLKRERVQHAVHGNAQNHPFRIIRHFSKLDCATNVIRWLQNRWPE